ncbi:MAG: hypothetical protein AMXMBFR4_00420 [Candidatus Hydrogenedentota bacterium]
MNDARKRIAMVGYTFYASDERLKRHVANLLDAGYAVDVVTLIDPRGARETDEEHVSFFLPMARHFERQGKVRMFLEYARFTVLAGLILLRNHLFRNSYALIHINNMPNFILFGALPLRLLGVPVLLDVHDTMPEIYQNKAGVPERHWMIRALFVEERVCMKLASFVITTEHTKWERLLENGLRKEKSAVTLNLADPSLFPRFDIPDGPVPAKPHFRLVYHGTLTHRLGMDIAIRAVALARSRIPHIRLEITGDGEQRPELLALTQELGIQDAVHFSDGFVPTEELTELLKGADLAVVPSRNNIATSLMLPVKLLEYVQLGIPVVTVATPTITRYFTEGMVHFVPPENPEALADKIVYLYERPELRLETARKARTFFERHNFETERDTYRAVVRRLLKEPSDSQ